jgi:hypothetical protein
MGDNANRMFKGLKRAWAVREFQAFRNDRRDGESPYIEQDSFKVPSEDGNYSEFDVVILVADAVEFVFAERFRRHVDEVGDDVKLAVVYI